MTADLHRSTEDARLEADLETLFAVRPSNRVIERIDGRVKKSLHVWEPSAAVRQQRRAGRRVGLVGLLAAVLVVGGATGNLQSLYFLIAGPFDVPWHRGEGIGLSQVVDGYRVTIDRAYADATRLALAISVVDEQERPGITQLAAFSTVVTDEDGEYGGMGATSTPDGPFAAVNIAWKSPAVLPLPSGPRTFWVELPFILVRSDATPPPGEDDEWSPWNKHPGPWTFEFELNVDGGTTIEPDVAAEVDGVTVHVSRVIAASGVVRAEVRIEGAPEDGSWAPIGSISHGGKTARFVASSFEDDGSVVMLTDGGLPSGAGDWTVTLDELVGGSQRLQGPWVVTFRQP
jgi:hypothetical protein